MIGNIVADTVVSGSGHWQRPEPVRTAPLRNGWSRMSSYPGSAAKAGETVHEAVRIGYQVIEDNIEQGREAASRLSRGSYQASDAQSDFLQMSSRLLQAGRDLTASYFDMLEGLIREVNSDQARRSSKQD